MWVPNALFCILVIVSINRVAHERPLVSPYIQELLERFVGAVVNLLQKAYVLIRRADDSEEKTPGETIVQKKILRGNARTRIFHFPECDYYYSQDCSVEFKDSEVALKAGFDPCMFCRTILADKQTDERQSG